MRSTYAVAPKRVPHFENTFTRTLTPYVGVESPTVTSLRLPARNHPADYLTTMNTIELGNNREPHGLAVSPDGERVYVTTLFSGTVEVIDTATGSVVTSVHVGGYTTGVSVTPDGTCLYIGEGHGRVYAMNTTTYALTTVVDSANYPGKDVAVTPDGRYLYALDNVFNEILVIKTRTNTIAATITLDQTPQSIVIARGSGLAYIGTDIAAKDPAGSVTVVDTAIHLVVDTLALPTGVKSVFLAPDENQLYAISETATVTIDTTTNIEVNSSPLRNSPEDVAITPDGRCAYIANSSSRSVAVLTRAHLSGPAATQI